MLLCCWLLPLGAQQMWVEDFVLLRRTLVNRSKIKVDKQGALLDLVTKEKGFTFVANGKQPAEAEEGDGVITVKLPRKTQYITIKHPDFGLMTWRVPVKHLKRKRHYRATLMTVNPDKPYKLQRQWVVFNISPENAILKIDSTVTLVRQRTTTCYLPLGNHNYQVESPFYESVKDSFLLTDTAKTVVDIRLQPVYSFLTVRTPWERGEIYIDGQAVAIKEGTSRRLAAGMHRLSVFMGESCYYDAFFNIGKAEKRVMTLTQKDFNPQPLKKTMATSVHGVQSDSAAVADTTVILPPEVAAPVQATVTLKAADESTEIWVDRELKGMGQWSGQLAQGYHLATTRKNDIEGIPTGLWVVDNFPQTVNLAVPETSQAVLNIYSNVVGADIYINKVHVGVTPCIVKDLHSWHDYDIRLQKTGYKASHRTVHPRGNDLIDVYVKMKKNINKK